MTVLLKMTRTEAAQLIAKRRREGSTVTTYSAAMIDADELVQALEALGVIRFPSPLDMAEKRIGVGSREPG